MTRARKLFRFFSPTGRGVRQDCLTYDSDRRASRTQDAMVESFTTSMQRSPDDEAFRRAAVAALCLYNDAILDNARRLGPLVIELRAVCSEVADYANEIEPSARGGAKIAAALCGVVTGHDFGAGRSLNLP
jgi:hypothetical protein